MHKEFNQLYTYKLKIFAHELLSVVTAPVIMCTTLPQSTAAIIDYFHDNTCHVEGLGLVCSQSVFD